MPFGVSERGVPDVVVPAMRRVTPDPPIMLIDVVAVLLLTMTKLSPALKMLAFIVTDVET